MAVHAHHLKANPEYRKNQEQLERYTTEYVKQVHRGEKQSRYGIIIIPVVVHVVYNTTAQNISDAQINDQIRILNEDYRKLNSDVTSVPSVFQPTVTDSRIQFALAVRGPDCTPTTGITRTYTTSTSFEATTHYLQSTSNGGHDPWPRDKYLNIWVAPKLMHGGDELCGYSQFPGDDPNTDGVSISYKFFGSIGTATYPYNVGRTATHEIGHWLNLYHIWGDDGTACWGTDYVDDTPNQAGFNSGCPAFPHITCSNGPNGDMFMNYMDYTYDACMFMFTAGQAARMDAALTNNSVGRAPILGSDALVPFSTSTDLWVKDTPEISE